MHGSTTVSATMILAARAGITVFVTGGIGGVHRGGESTMDISADLTELGRTPVAVVCAGAKSVLDIPRTLEFLETQGVTVAAYQCEPPALLLLRLQAVYVGVGDSLPFSACDAGRTNFRLSSRPTAGARRRAGWTRRRRPLR